MTVLGRGLVFQLVLVTQTCTYNSSNIITLQNIDITDFPSKKKNNKTKQKIYIPTPPPPHNYQRERERERERFTMVTLTKSQGH